MDFSNKYSENHIIVSSRSLEEFIGWSDFVEFSSMQLNKKQALSLISKLDYDDELKNKFYKQLDDELYEKYKSFASNPLLLTIMLMTFEGRVSIPDSKTDFYEQAFLTLFHKHDAMKKGKYKREILSGLGYEDFKKIFSYFCFRTFFKNQYEFTEKNVLENIERAKEKVHSVGDFKSQEYLKDLTNAVCMLVHEGLNYRFSHRSFQEYFAAVYVTQLSDKEQKQFITSWLKESGMRLTTDFLDILCELQPDRFMKNILYDGIHELYDMYQENGCSDDWFIEFMYSYVSLYRYNDSGCRFVIGIRSHYYDIIFDSMLHYLNYPCEYRPNNEYRRKFEEKLKLFQKQGEITFKELKDKGLFEDLKKALPWIIDRKEFVFNSLDKIDINIFGKKRKFESMLDDL